MRNYVSVRISDQERHLDLRDEVRALASGVIYVFSLGLNGKIWVYFQSKEQCKCSMRKDYYLHLNLKDFYVKIKE